MIKHSVGEVSVERGGKKIIAVVGTPVQVEDRVRTGPKGTVGITLRDNTLLSAGPNSLLTINQFAFDALSQAGAMSIGVQRGTLAASSGQIAKKNPEAVSFRTPTSVLGIRGTEFVVEVVGGGE